jgi:hypothetical protein
MEVEHKAGPKHRGVSYRTADVRLLSGDARIMWGKSLWAGVQIGWWAPNLVVLKALVLVTYYGSAFKPVTSGCPPPLALQVLAQEILVVLDFYLLPRGSDVGFEA